MASPASAIEDPTSLCGETLRDQDGGKIGEVKELYTVGSKEEPMWITVAVETGIGRYRRVFVPLARVKYEHDQLRVPYTAQHLLGSPETEADGELSAQQDIALRNYYAIDLADQEIRTDNDSYASQVPESDEAPKRSAGRR